MALTFNQLSSTLKDSFVPVLVDNFFGSNPLFRILKDKSKKEDLIEGGVTIKVPLAYGGAAGGAYSGLDVLTVSPDENITAAQFSWKQHRRQVAISGRDLRLSQDRPNQVLDLLAAQMRIAEQSLADGMGTDIFGDGTGAGGDALDGLLNGIDDGTNFATYGGITRSGATWWEAQMDHSASARAVTLDALTTDAGLASVGNDVPDLVVSTQALRDKIANLMQVQQRFPGETFQLGTARPIELQSAKLEVDSHCPSKYIFFLNTKYIHLKSHKGTFFIPQPPIRPSGVDGMVWDILWMGNLVIDNCRMFCKADNYDSTL